MKEQLKLVVLCATVMACLNLQSAEITKASTGAVLNQGGSWIGGAGPGSGDVGLWSSTSSSLRTGLSLGSDLSWAGIKVTGAGGVAIAAGSTLSLGGNGINISIGSGSSLTLSHAVSVASDQTWTIGASTGLGLNGALSGNSQTINVVSGGSGSYVNLYGSAANFSGTINYGAASRLNLRGAFAGANVTLNLTAPRSVYADSTIGTVVIGDLATALGGSILGADAQNGAVTYEIGAVGNSSTWAGSIRNGGADLSKTTSLRKVGSGTWSLSGTNTYTGTTTIDNGAIRVLSAVSQLGTNSAAIVTINTLNGVQFGGGLTSFTLFGLAGSSAGSVVLANDLGAGVALTLNQAGNTTFAGVLTGSGALVKSGAGALTLAASSSLSGGVTIVDGTLTLPAAINNSIGGGALTLSGGLVNLGYNAIYTNAIHVPGTATMRGSANNYAMSGTLTGGGTLTLARGTSGVIWFTGDAGGFNGTIICDGLGFTGTGNSFGPNGKGNTWTNVTVDLRNGARFRGQLGGVNKLGALKGEAGTTLGGSSGGIFEVGYLNTTDTFNGLVADSGTDLTALAKVGTGKLELTANNDYTGATTIGDGTLALSSTGSIGNSTNIVVGSGAFFDVSAVGGGFVLGPNQRLGGNGTVIGPATVGGVVAPGASVGTLTFATAPALSGTVLMEINQTNVQTSDKLTVSGGVLSYGGALVVTNIGFGLTNGTFTLFEAAGYAGAFSSVQLPPGGTQHWRTDRLAVDGTISFTNVSPVAMDVLLGARLGDTVSVPIIGGKNSPSDADDDNLSVLGVGPASSGTASNTSTSVIYTASGTVGTNTFTYTISDGVGGIDTRTVTVLVYSPEGFNRVDATSLGNNTLALSYLGIPGVNYALDWATNLATPIEWMPVTTNTASVNGWLYFTNTGVGLDFYRTRHVP